METKKLISGRTETTGISLINFQDSRWVSTSLLHSRAYQYSTAKVYVFSDSVLCALHGKNARQFCWILEEASSMVFGQRLFQRIESNWWTNYGIRVEDFPRIHCSGNPQWDSIDDGKITVWTRELDMQHHLSWQCLTTLSGMQKEMMNYV